MAVRCCHEYHGRSSLCTFPSPHRPNTGFSGAAQAVIAPGRDGTSGGFRTFPSSDRVPLAADTGRDAVGGFRVGSGEVVSRQACPVRLACSGARADGGAAGSVAPQPVVPAEGEGPVVGRPHRTTRHRGHSRPGRGSGERNCPPVACGGPGCRSVRAAPDDGSSPVEAVANVGTIMRSTGRTVNTLREFAG